MRGIMEILLSRSIAFNMINPGMKVKKAFVTMNLIQSDVCITNQLRAIRLVSWVKSVNIKTKNSIIKIIEEINEGIAGILIIFLCLFLIK
jgi:hypothetical protein